MRFQLQWASAAALVGAVSTALLSAQGSGAAASDHTPVPVETVPSISFISQPVVQALPGDPAPSEAAAPGSADDSTPDAGDDAAPDARTLAELVKQQDVGGSLSADMRCLAGAIYFEARGETLEGQLAVGRVIVNRAQSGRFPSSYCGVVYQPSQFSFVRGGTMPSINRSSRAWDRAVRIARIADKGLWESPVEGAMFFHATYVSPRWGKARLARIDGHIFYR